MTDVHRIYWLLDNTCNAIEELQPLYYAQGVDFCRRMQAGIDYDGFLTDHQQREPYLATIKQNEQQTLQQLYEPKLKSRPADLQASVTNPKISSFVKELNKRRKHFQDTARNAVHSSALQEVEQEREVAFEVESVRQVKKPFQFTALAFPGLHRDLEAFVRTGHLPADPSGVSHFLVSMARTGLGQKFRTSRTASSSKLFVSVEFNRSVKLVNDVPNDNFLVRFLPYSTLKSLTPSSDPSTGLFGPKFRRRQSL